MACLSRHGDASEESAMKIRAVILLLLGLSTGLMAFGAVSIVIPPHASEIETLAAREVRRYFYLRTGELAPIVSTVALPSGDVVVVARNDRPLAAEARAGALAAEQYVVKSDGHRVWIVGGDDIGTLYAAYRFAEGLGVRFYLHGDVVPDDRIAATFPRLDETGKPLFAVRGVLPFHDFPEGPDWWNRDDYLAYVAQLPKLRMNFIGFHTYPEGRGVAESAVWIGLPADTDKFGHVGFSYPSEWANTGRPAPCYYTAMKTSDFTAGAGLLFDREMFGPEVMAGLMPAPQSLADCNTLFDRAGALFQEAFSEAKFLSVKTCIGTETPLGIPKRVQARLVSEGKDPKNPAVVKELYEGMFRRIAAACPVDTYWLWTPESWTWASNQPGEFKATTQDIGAALGALDAIGRPFNLATSGWVLGPKEDRTALDRFLPKDSPMSCINREDGHAPDEPGFANVTGRPKWVIPWLENDPSLTAPQPWVGRMRYDAMDARRLGCSGLIGIHWRTKIIAGNIAALAAAGWEQPWVPQGFDASPIAPGAAVPDASAANSDLKHPRRARTMPVEDFYVDFARANFGERAAQPVGRLFAGIDGVNLPEPSAWLKGPGGVKVDPAPWSEVRRRYAFVDELAAMRGLVEGPGNLERFDYWLNTYRAMAAMANAGCERGALDRAMAAVAAEKDPGKRRELGNQALFARIHLARLWERMMGLQVQVTDTPGELGTLADLEQHSRAALQFLGEHDEELAKVLGAHLPAAVELSKDYTGPARLVVPTVRTLVQKGEPLSLKIFILDRQPAAHPSVFYRPMGEGAYREIPITRVARAVYGVTIPPLTEDIEYYLRAETSSGEELIWPSTAPSLAQTVVAR